VCVVREVEKSGERMTKLRATAGKDFLGSTKTNEIMIMTVDDGWI
jgi:hypothetical protein